MASCYDRYIEGVIKMFILIGLAIVALVVVDVIAGFNGYSDDKLRHYITLKEFKEYRNKHLTNKL